MKNYDIVIVGGGPAGLAAAISAYDSGCKNILIIERDNRLGGILNQCIHNGFGLHTFKEELTGPEYAARFISQVHDRSIDYLLNTMVMNIDANSDTKLVTAMNSNDGMFVVQCRSIILAMGCRERARGALNIPGYRPSGVYSAGTAQRLVNIEGQMPGKRVVILGSGDIGLIMARRMTLEGAKVLCVAELMPYSGGLKRNIVQCLDDFDIPLFLSHTVCNIEGKKRIEAITIAQVGPDRKPIPGTEKRYECDTLLLSCGLLPENELSNQAGISINPITSGPIVNDSLETNIPGIFACGNVLHVHDLVDFVSSEAAAAGASASRYALGDFSSSGSSLQIKAQNGARYTVPSSIRLGDISSDITIRFRVGSVYKNSSIVAKIGDKELIRRKKAIMAPGEMEQVIIKPDMIANCTESDELIIEIQEN